MRGSSHKEMACSIVLIIVLMFANFSTCISRDNHWKSRSKGDLLSEEKKSQHGHHKHNHRHHNHHHRRPSPCPKSKPKPSPSQKPDGDVFDVLDFGAKGDGVYDNTEAFQAAWAAACRAKASKLLVPANNEFLIGPISFFGHHCQSNIVVQLDGIIVAPISSEIWGSGLLHWIQFKYLKDITIQGNGVIEGQGAVWWDTSKFLHKPISPIYDFHHGKMSHKRPTALRFYKSHGVSVSGITIRNSPKAHLKFDRCNGVEVFNIKVSSPGSSPNTDCIHLQNSQNTVIHHNQLSCGDDCVSIQTGCSNINIHHVNCGPGHGISIGGLGKEKTKATVSNVTVKDITFKRTMWGVRIKTWQGGSGSVNNIKFSNIKVDKVRTPIMINQYYCDKSSCKNQSAAVKLSDVSYENIKGTYTRKPVHLACSNKIPCRDISLTNIELKPVKTPHHHINGPFCWQAYGQLSPPILPPIACLQSGKPSNN